MDGTGIEPVERDLEKMPPSASSPPVDSTGIEPVGISVGMLPWSANSLPIANEGMYSLNGEYDSRGGCLTITPKTARSPAVLLYHIYRRIPSIAPTATPRAKLKIAMTMLVKSIAPVYHWLKLRDWRVTKTFVVPSSFFNVSMYTLKT